MSPLPFHVVLQVPLGAAQGLEEGLRALSLVDPPLRRVELRLDHDAQVLLAQLGFDDSRAFTLQHSRVGSLAVSLFAKVIDLENLGPDGLARFVTRRDALPVVASAEGDLSRVFTELRRHQAALVLRVSFDSEAALLAAWAHHVAEGALWVPTSRPTDAEVFSVIFATPSDEYADNRALRVRRTPPPGRSGIYLEIQPSAALSARLDAVARERRGFRSSFPPAAVPRHEADLDMRVEQVSELQAQYDSNISHGGLFVSTPTPAPLRTRLSLHLTLPNGEVLTLPAEVVHRELSGPRMGVGLQFVDLKPDTFAPIEALLAQPLRRPRVLVVEDEAIWRSTLVRVLRSLDADIVLARDGREGLVKLTDQYFDLDLAILDLHMPHLDGQGLIHRVRRLGGDTTFKIFLFSAASRDELDALREGGLATAVFSKLDPLDVLATHLARELGRVWTPVQPVVSAWD